MSYTLVVVDMQDSFNAANEPNVRNNIEREIKKAMAVKAAVIFLEYSGMGPTIPRLTRLTDGYERGFSAIKNHNDGSRQVENLIDAHNLPRHKIKVTGVNTDYCVRETVFGLAANMKPTRLQVIADACWSDYDHDYGLRRVKEVSTVIK